MAKRYWETLLKDKDKDKETPMPWWLKGFFVIGILIGFSGVFGVAVLFFLFLGWCFSGLWNYAITPIFNVMEITSYMGAALLALIFWSIRLLKWAFKN